MIFTFLKKSEKRNYSFFSFFGEMEIEKQQKLSRAEWNTIEIPVSAEEKGILRMVMNGYHAAVRQNDSWTLLSYTKLAATAGPELNAELFRRFFGSRLDRWTSLVGSVKDKKRKIMLGEKVDILCSAATTVLKRAVPIKKADAIRLEKLTEMSADMQNSIYEFVQMDRVDALVKLWSVLLSTEPTVADVTLAAKEVYTILHLQCAFLPNCNTVVDMVLTAAVDLTLDIPLMGGPKGVLRRVFFRCDEVIERNSLLMKFADRELYGHQKKLFSLLRSWGERRNAAACGEGEDPGGLLVLYTAPTGTGKTMSPLALCEEYRVIFVCAARHVGLALARAAVSMGRKIAFAFGCETAEDVRLHYFSAKEYTRHNKSGAIFKVDNSVGDNVELMICDVKSYPVAMRYMCAFHPVHRLVMYWDEPTIALDRQIDTSGSSSSPSSSEDVSFYGWVGRAWQENRLPTVVLSSATLPTEEELLPLVENFREKFDIGRVEVATVSSWESKKSVRVIDKDGRVVLPHTMFDGDSFDGLMRSAAHCLANPVLLKYLDAAGVSEFLFAVDEMDSTILDSFFDELMRREGDPKDALRAVHMYTVKKMYLEVLRGLGEDQWLSLVSSRQVWWGSGGDGGILFTTRDARTITDGPAIYLAEDVDKVAAFYVQQSGIPEAVLTRLHGRLQTNTRVQEQLEKLQRDLDDMLGREADKSRKMASGAGDDDGRFSPAVRAAQREKDLLLMKLQPMSLEEVYIPNTPAHQRKWARAEEMFDVRAFTCRLDEATVSRVVNLADVDPARKLLLLMGIGVFQGGGREDAPGQVEYLEIIKQLAYQQRLFFIFAASDYIYGTNYQFCHAVLGRDLTSGLTPQKMIQAIGRVGRMAIQQTYTVRLRDNTVLRKLFCPSEEPAVEAQNMCHVFLFNE